MADILTELQYVSGKGTKADPWIISNIDGFIELITSDTLVRENYQSSTKTEDVYISLECDIDCRYVNDLYKKNIPTIKFNTFLEDYGVLDVHFYCNNHIIKNLYNKTTMFQSHNYQKLHVSYLILDTSIHDNNTLPVFTNGTSDNSDDGLYFDNCTMSICTTCKGNISDSSGDNDEVGTSFRYSSISVRIPNNGTIFNVLFHESHLHIDATYSQTETNPVVLKNCKYYNAFIDGYIEINNIKKYDNTGYFYLITCNDTGTNAMKLYTNIEIVSSCDFPIIISVESEHDIASMVSLHNKDLLGDNLIPTTPNETSDKWLTNTEMKSNVILSVYGYTIDYFS